MVKILFGLLLGLTLGWFVVPVPGIAKDGMRALVAKYPALAPYVKIE